MVAMSGLLSIAVRQQYPSTRGRAKPLRTTQGRGSKRAVALVHHIDVVPADARYWSVDPFAGVVKDGYVWGRGAIDFKGQGIAHLVALLALKRSGVPLTRDVVFIGNADEELWARAAQRCSCSSTARSCGTSSTSSTRARGIASRTAACFST